MKKLLAVVFAVVSLGVISLQAGAACVPQQQQSGPWVYVPEEHN